MQISADLTLKFQKWLWNWALSRRGAIWLGLLFAAGAFFLAGLQYNLLARTTTLPEVTLPPEISNQVSQIRSEKPFLVVLKGEKTESIKEADNLYTFTFSEKSGPYVYRVYGVKSTPFYTVRSSQYLGGSLVQDLESPVISNLEVAERYLESQVEFRFQTSEEVQVLINEEEGKCAEADLIYTCFFTFKEEGSKNLEFSFIDSANNLTQTTVQTLYTPRPEIACEGEVPGRTNQLSFELACTLNKEGELFLNGEEVDFTPRQAETITFNLIDEGENTLELRFVDTYDLEVVQTYEVVRDTTAPTAEFTFLDTKKIFQEGTVAVGFTVNEAANAQVRFYPVNNFFETDDLARQILQSGNFVYEGGESFGRELAAGQEARFETSNNFALCQVLSPTNKNCFSPGVVGIETILTDELGNQRTYLCNNWLATDTARLEGLEATTCQER